MRRTASHRIALSALLALVSGPAAHAVDAIELTVRELTVAGIPVRNAAVRLDVLSNDKTRLSVRADSAEIADVGKFQDLSLTCEAPVIAEPRYGCAAGHLTGRGGPTGSIEMSVKGEMRTDTGVTTFSGNGLKVAGTTAAFDGKLDAQGWRIDAKTGVTKVGDALAFAKPWFEMPKGLTFSGQVAFDIGAADRGKGTSADI